MLEGNNRIAIGYPFGGGHAAHRLTRAEQPAIKVDVDHLAQGRRARSPHIRGHRDASERND